MSKILMFEFSKERKKEKLKRAKSQDESSGSVNKNSNSVSKKRKSFVRSLSDKITEGFRIKENNKGPQPEHISSPHAASSLEPKPAEEHNYNRGSITDLFSPRA